MKKKKVVIAIVVSVIVVAFIAIGLIRSFTATMVGTVDSEEMLVQVQKVKKEKLDESILLTGKIVPVEEQKIYKNPENGDIVEFKVKENDKVEKGTPLFVYDGAQLEREFNAAVNARDRSNQHVNMVQNQINELTKQIDALKKLEKTASEEDDYEIASISENDIRQLEMEKSQLLMELESAKAEVQLAQSEINDLDKMKKELTVKSNIEGTVVKVNENEDRDETGMTEPVVHIVSNKPFKVIGSMSEFDSVKIKPDQSVIIRPKVFKDREWKGKVEYVSEYPSDDGSSEMDFYDGGDMNVTMYPFRVAIEDDTKDLRQGFHVSLEVDVSGSEAKLVVPHMAIMDELMLGMHEDDSGFVDDIFGFGGGLDENMQFVFVLVDGVLERRDIETGKMSDEFVEIISGVELDELVVINPTPEMYDGMEVAHYDQVD